MPKCMKVNTQVVSQIMGDSTAHAAVLFHTPTCPHCVSFLPTFRQAAMSDNVPRDTMFATVDVSKHIGALYKLGEDEYGKSIGKFIGTHGVPTLLLFNGTCMRSDDEECQEDPCVLYTGERSIQGIVDAATSYWSTTQ